MDPDRRTAPDRPLAPHPVLRSHYRHQRERADVVQRLFDDAAGSYDRVTALMSLGTGRRYRLDALRRAGVGPGSRVLDVACGTGQVSVGAAALAGPAGVVIGVDPSDGMRRIAASRGIRTLQGRAEALPVRDGLFDVVVMGYALRHVADLGSAFAELRRALRPGGRLLILEITPPEGAVPRAILRAYLKAVVPIAALVVSGDRRAMNLMRYYWDSIEQCVPPRSILEAMREAGLKDPEHRRVLGIFSEYSAARA